MGVRTTPCRLNDHEDNEGGALDVGGDDGNGGAMLDVGGAAEAEDDEVEVLLEFIRTFQGKVKGSLSWHGVGNDELAEEADGTDLADAAVTSGGRRGERLRPLRRSSKL